MFEDTGTVSPEDIDRTFKFDAELSLRRRPLVSTSDASIEGSVRPSPLGCTISGNFVIRGVVPPRCTFTQYKVNKLNNRGTQYLEGNGMWNPEAVITYETTVQCICFSSRSY